MHHEQLGLGTVLPRAQACDGVGPAVELPGLGHVVDADDEGQAAREECVSQLRVKDQVVAPSRTIVVHAAAGENVRRICVDALVRTAWQCPQVGQRVLVQRDRQGGCWRRRTLLSASNRCCAKEPHFPEKLLRSRTYAQAARRPARPLSAPGRRCPE